MEKEFSSIYIFNLRGNARTSGEIRRRERDNVFGMGSRTPVAITILVRNPNNIKERADIYYHDIGDYLTREEKLNIITEFKSCMSTKFPVTVLKPNEYGDWLNQRNGMFESFIPLGDKKDRRNTHTVFCNRYSNGIKTQRDAWCYNSSKYALAQNIQTTIDFYEKERGKCTRVLRDGNRNYEPTYDSTKINWTRATLNILKRDVRLFFDENRTVESFYRPFCKQYLHNYAWLIEMEYLMPGIFPTPLHKNLVICVSGTSGTKEMSVLIAANIVDLHFNGDTQCFPLYYYEKSDVIGGLFADMPEEAFSRYDGITDFVWKQAKELYGSKVTKEDIFYYVYGFLHLPSYRKEFAADLKKSLPRLMLVKEPKKFWHGLLQGRQGVG